MLKPVSLSSSLKDKNVTVNKRILFVVFKAVAAKTKLSMIPGHKKYKTYGTHCKILVNWGQSDSLIFHVELLNSKARKAVA